MSPDDNPLAVSQDESPRLTWDARGLQRGLGLRAYYSSFKVIMVTPSMGSARTIWRNHHADPVGDMGNTWGSSASLRRSGGLPLGPARYAVGVVLKPQALDNPLW